MACWFRPWPRASELRHTLCILFTLQNLKNKGVAAGFNGPPAHVWRRKQIHRLGDETRLSGSHFVSTQSSLLEPSNDRFKKGAFLVQRVQTVTMGNNLIPEAASVAAGLIPLRLTHIGKY